jgi:hypothetical protein
MFKKHSKEVKAQNNKKSSASSSHHLQIGHLASKATFIAWLKFRSPEGD